MNNKSVLITLITIINTICIITLGGCGGLESMPSKAMAGDTVVLAAGWKHFERNEITVTITDYSGVTTTYAPGDPAVRAVINLYPDPLSYIVTGTRTGSDEGLGNTYGSMINYNNTNHDPDWWQTTIYLDLPATMSTGIANIFIEANSGESYEASLEVIPGQGSPETFDAEMNGGLTPVQMRSMERRPSYTVKFSGYTEMPEAIEVNLSHLPDESLGGVGRPLVVNPRGEMKNIIWNDDGTQMKVLLFNSGKGTWNDPYLSEYKLQYFKFYITGGIEGLAVDNCLAYDQEGAVLPGVVASIE